LALRLLVPPESGARGWFTGDHASLKQPHQPTVQIKVNLAILGLDANDVEELEALIVEAIQIHEAIPSDVDDCKQHYILDFLLTRNQNIANIRTTWIIRPNETFPRLTSCYIRR
jgi:hypothetical protein